MHQFTTLASTIVSILLKLPPYLDFLHLKPSIHIHALVLVVALLIGSASVNTWGHVVCTGVVAVAVVYCTLESDSIFEIFFSFWSHGQLSRSRTNYIYVTCCIRLYLRCKVKTSVFLSRLQTTLFWSSGAGLALVKWLENKQSLRAVSVLSDTLKINSGPSSNHEHILRHRQVPQAFIDTSFQCHMYRWKKLPKRYFPLHP